MKKGEQLVKEKYTSLPHADFILQSPLLDAIEVKNKIRFSKKVRKKSLVEQLSTVQTIFSDYE